MCGGDQGDFSTVPTSSHGRTCAVWLLPASRWACAICHEFIQLLLFPQSLGNTELPEDDVTLSDTMGPFPPQWRCYAKLVNPQHVFLTFLPATFSGEGVCCGEQEEAAVLSTSSGKQKNQNQLL